MKKFLFFLGFLIASTLQLKAHVISSTDLSHENSNKLSSSHYKGLFTDANEGSDTNAAAVGEGIGYDMYNGINSFIDLVSEKIVDKLEAHLERDGVSDKMLVLLQNDAELFDVDNYKGQNLALIQSLFFNKLRKKFNESNFGKKVKALGGRVKQKLVSLYHEHKDKLKHFFKVLLKGMVLPLFINFIRKHINKWRTNTIEAVKKIKGETRKIAVPIVYRVYDHVEEQINEVAEKNGIALPQEEALEELEHDQKEIAKLEKAEDKLLKHPE